MSLFLTNWEIVSQKLSRKLAVSRNRIPQKSYTYDTNSNITLEVYYEQEEQDGAIVDVITERITREYEDDRLVGHAVGILPAKNSYII